MYLKINLELLKNTDSDTAIFYANLVFWADYFKTGTIHQTQEQVENHTGLTRKKQDKAIAKLEELGKIQKTIKKVKGATVRTFKITAWEDMQIGKKFVENFKKNVENSDSGNVQKEHFGMSKTVKPYTINIIKETKTVKIDKQKDSRSIAQVMEGNKYAHLFKKYT